MKDLLNKVRWPWYFNPTGFWYFDLHPSNLRICLNESRFPNFYFEFSKVRMHVYIALSHKWKWRYLRIRKEELSK